MCWFMIIYDMPGRTGPSQQHKNQSFDQEHDDGCVDHEVNDVGVHHQHSCSKPPMRTRESDSPLGHSNFCSKRSAA